MIDLSKHSNRELLTLFSEVMTELKTRKVTRSSNSPAADYAEALVAKALSLTLAPPSTTGYDGTDPFGKKVEVKCRRISAHNKSRQLSAIRGMEHRHFDYLAGVLFDADFSVRRAALIPYSVVKDRAVFIPHTNGWKFVLVDSVWDVPGVQDITIRVQEAQS